MPSAGIAVIGIVLVISAYAIVHRFVTAGRRRAKTSQREARRQKVAAERAREAVREILQGLANRLHFELSRAASESKFGENIGLRLMDSRKTESWFCVTAWYRPPERSKHSRDLTIADSESGEIILAVVTVVFDGRRAQDKVIEVGLRGNLEEESAYFCADQIEKVIALAREQILTFHPPRAA